MNVKYDQQDFQKTEVMDPLLKAAPEMLSACAEALQFLVENATKLSFDRVNPIADRLAKAIAKAEGRIK